MHPQTRNKAVGRDLKDEAIRRASRNPAASVSGARSGCIRHRLYASCTLRLFNKEG